jgi:AcrR family transcriptional regulator
MYKLCQTEKSYQRQREMEQGLLQLMLKRDYAGISVSDLCEYMQIPRKSFYRYFSSKDGALYALIDHRMSDFFQMPQPANSSFKSGAVGDLELFFVYWYENKDFLDALQRSGLSGILMERANAFALQEGHIPGKFRTVPTRMQGIALSFAVSGLISMTLNWHRQGFIFTPAEMTRMAVDMLTTPLLNT